MALTSKQTELLREFVELGGLGEIMGAIEAQISNEWRNGGDLVEREASHAKFLALRDVRRQFRSIAGSEDG